MDSIDMAQVSDQWMALIRTVMNHQVSSNFWEFSEWLATGSFSLRVHLHGLSC
jgi:hypothetical protein